LLVAKEESFAFGSASSVGRPGQSSPSELVDGFDDSTVNIKGAGDRLEQLRAWGGVTEVIATEGIHRQLGGVGHLPRFDTAGK
jgi:hypothetical protein